MGDGKQGWAQWVRWLLSSPGDTQPVFHSCFIWFTLCSPSITDGNLKISEKGWKESLFLARSKHQLGTTQLQDKPRKSIVLVAHIPDYRIWWGHLANLPKWAVWLILVESCGSYSRKAQWSFILPCWKCLAQVRLTLPSGTTMLGLVMALKYRALSLEETLMEVLESKSRSFPFYYCHWMLSLKDYFSKRQKLPSRYFHFSYKSVISFFTSSSECNDALAWYI